MIPSPKRYHNYRLIKKEGETRRLRVEIPHKKVANSAGLHVRNL